MNRDEFHKMQTGDVLVSTMTTPDFVILMQQASAIITDIGGLLCHAAIVSREIHRPCIIGMKNATKVLKDGDLIEVDADNGIVRILKHAEGSVSTQYEPSEKIYISRSRSKKNCDLFPAIFTQEYVATAEMEEMYGIKARATIYTWIGDDVTTATDSNQDFEKMGSKLLDKFLNESKWLDGVLEWSEKVKYSLRDFVLKEFPEVKTSSMSNGEVAEKYLEYCKKYTEYHLKNTPAWWIGIPAIEREFEKYVKSGKISAENLGVLMESMSYVHDLTQEELNLLKIAGKIKEGKLKVDDKLPKEIDELLDDHVLRFSSIPFAYKNYVIWDKKYFLNKIHGIISEVDPIEELKRKETELKEKAFKQQELLKKLNLDDRLKSLIITTQKLGYLQDLKKVFQTTSHPHLQTIIAPEIMKRLNIDRKYFGSLSPIEIKDGLLNGGLDEKVIKELPLRLENSVLIARDNKYEWILGDKAISFAKKHGFIVSTDIGKELKGNSASSGKVRGTVKVCITSHDISKVNKGDILVASMTTPDYVPAMKKAGAIVTDEGGITCHAAIVGRELNLPCVIATKNATKVLKDGDVVEVDADKGVVRIIEIAKNDKNPEGDKESSDFMKIVVHSKNESDFDFSVENKYFGLVSRKTSLIARSLIVLGYTSNAFYEKMIGYPTKMNVFYDSERGIYVSRRGMENERETALKMLEKNPNFISDIADKGEVLGNELWKYSYDLKKEDFTKKPSDELKNILVNFFTQQCNVSSFILFPLSIQPWLESTLKEEIRKKIKDEVKVDEYFNIISTPIKNNFHYDEQEAIINMAIDFEDTKQIDKQKIKQYLDKFGSTAFKYGIGVAWTEEQVSLRIKEIEDPKKKLNELRDFHKESVDQIQKILSDLDASDDFKKIVKLVRTYIWFRTFRTDVLSHSLANALPLLEEVGRRNNLTVEEVLECLPNEIISFEFPSKEVIAERSVSVITHGRGGKLYYEFGNGGNELLEKLKVVAGVKKDSELENSNIIIGMSAFKGNIRGLVKVLLTNKDISKVNRGDIIIASMTTPDFIPAMEKAVAFITDEGGILCHAAIVSREMRKPCVIGTKIATRILKDGDMVEVDADKGIVTIIK